MELYVKDMPSAELNYFNNLFSPTKPRPARLLLKDPVKPTFKKFPVESASPAAETLVVEKPRLKVERRTPLLREATFSVDRKQALPPHKYPHDSGLQ